MRLSRSSTVYIEALNTGDLAVLDEIFAEANASPSC